MKPPSAGWNIITIKMSPLLFFFMTAEKYSTTYNVMIKNLSNNVLLILVGYFFVDTIFGLFFLCPSLADARTATEMDGTLHTDFRKSETSRDMKKYF